MKILGIETSCDDTAAAVIEAKGGFNNPSFSVLSNVSHSQIAIHKKFGGIVPNLASRAHLEKIIPAIKSALLIPRINSKDIDLTPTPRQVGGRGSDQSVGVDLIAVTKGPGLAPSLLVGINTARALAYKWQKPIIGVNHIEGHIYSNWLPPVREFSNFNSTTCRRSSGSRIIPNPQSQIDFPALILIVSGGHTELILMSGYGKYKIIGQTLDDAAGECFDKTARLLGLGFPGGPAIARLADKCENKIFRTQIPPIGQKCVLMERTNRRTKLPRPMINSKDYNFSFSGLKTAVLYLYNDLTKNLAPSNSNVSIHSNKDKIKEIKSAMAYEIQNAIVDVLVAKTLKAARNFNPKSVMIAGGVSANKKLRKEITSKLKSYNIPLFIPEMDYTTDNAAMIAAAGYFNYLKKKPDKNSWKNITMDANLRL